MPIKIKIKTIWMGKIGIRDKYIKQADNEKKDILIVKGNDMMIIPYEKMNEAMVGRSEFQVRDRYSSESHFLYYFMWKPTTVQKQLF